MLLLLQIYDQLTVLVAKHVPEQEEVAEGGARHWPLPSCPM